jgi:hypothetical protein
MINAARSKLKTRVNRYSIKHDGASAAEARGGSVRFYNRNGAICFIVALGSCVLAVPPEPQNLVSCGAILNSTLCGLAPRC